MKIIRLTPACKDYPWGGALLREKYGVNSDLEPLAEAWVLSCHPDGESIIAEGEHQGQRLSGYAAQYGANFWGTKCEEFGGLPLLIKLIDAKTNLSIQVHPDNAYALEHEHQYGKTEMWYVMEAAPDAYLYYGLKKSVTKGELSKSITDGTIIDLLRAVPVHAGDLFFIPAGTIHAICGGTVIAEIQQNSNVTYRVFDYNRIGKDGKKRQLHVQQALDVVNLNPTPLKWDFGPHLATCPYFTVDKVVGPARGICSEESFVSILIVKGQGTVSCAGECAPTKQGDSFVLPAGSGGWAIDGNCEALVTQLE